jgi:glutamine synthetase
MSAKSPADVISEIRALSTQKVKVAVTDVDGILRGKYLLKEKFLKAAESGMGFCNVVLGWDCNDTVYDNTIYTGWHTGYPDAPVRLDLSTYRRVPWDNSVPFVLGEFVDSKGNNLGVCPRGLTKRALAMARSAGFEPMVGVEYEWFNFKETPQTLAAKDHVNPEPLSPGMFGYSILRSSLNRPFFNALMDQLREFDVPLEGLHTETGPGVYEAAILYSDALTAADRGVLFKTAAKEIAYQHGAVASFMARWNTKLPGCGGHLHQSLLGKDGTNAFFDDKDPHKMSATFKSYLAGQMRCLPEILPLFAPNVNSFKRLVEGYWAPTRVTWAVDNRTAAFRVIPGSKHSTRLETRVGGADINAYLAVAAAVASGIYGIENGLKLTEEPIVGNGYRTDRGVHLPKSLIEATEKFERSEIARELFGAEFVEHFAKSREWEWRQSQQAVTDWELKRYFEII